MEGRSRSAAMPVAERFVSINGEGPRAGRFAAFVRFAGCNLSCSYCDTRWACQPGCPVEQLSCAQIARWVLEQGVPCATLTGGEPLLQPLLPELARILLEQGSCTVEIETNGACSVEPLCALRAAHPGRLALTLDCKLPSSGMAQHMLEGNYALLGEADCVKFVAGSEEDLVEAARVMREHGLLQRCPVYVSPVFGQIEPADIVGFLQREGLTGARVQLQLHKLIWPGVEKGV
ncbi:MAG: radical SAM protein [Coriobacteriaceae bacterium]|nr:radical SAM protein [Coriobacteriaceae bacterium]